MMMIKMCLLNIAYKLNACRSCDEGNLLKICRSNFISVPAWVYMKRNKKGKKMLEGSKFQSETRRRQLIYIYINHARLATIYAGPIIERVIVNVPTYQRRSAALQHYHVIPRCRKCARGAKYYSVYFESENCIAAF